MYGANSGHHDDLTVSASGDLVALREPWTALANASGNLFSTWEWASVWWRHYGEGLDPMLLLCADAGGVAVGLVPLHVTRVGPLRMARFIGHGAADELGPVCAPSELGAVVSAVKSHGRAGRCWGVLLAERLPGGRDWQALFDGSALNAEASPVIDVAGITWEEYLASRSSNFRSQIRRKERKLQREHGLTYRLADDPDRLDSDMELLFELHEKRWAGDHEGTTAFDERRRAFHRDFAAVALERGWLRLWIAEADGRAVAAWHGFRYGNREWYYQFGRDPEFDRLSLGLVLLAHTLREAIGDGVDQYRLLRGGESYKDRFATSDPGVTTVASPAGATGRAALAVARAALGLPAPLRRAVVSRLR